MRARGPRATCNWTATRSRCWSCWSLLVLPKRQRQIARQESERQQDQEQMFAELKPVPVGQDMVEPINERTLVADFGDKLGGKFRINLSLGALQRHGFIVRRKERIAEGPLLDLAFDYERIASRVMDGALSFVVEQARATQAANADSIEDDAYEAPLADEVLDDKETATEAQADV